MAANPQTEFKLFESQQYGESDLLFKDATQCLVHTSHMDYRSILGDEFYSHAETVFNCTHSSTIMTKYIYVMKQINYSLHIFIMLMFTSVFLCLFFFFFLQQKSWSFVIRTCAAYFNGHTDARVAFPCPSSTNLFGPDLMTSKITAVITSQQRLKSKLH